VSPALEIVLWLIFASIIIGGLGLTALLVWVTLQAMARVWIQATRSMTPAPISVPTFGSATVRNSIGIVATFWLSLLVLIPLLALALWQFAVELGGGRVGGSLVLSIVHLVLIWALLHLGTHVQRKIELSTIGLVAHPVIGPRRELAWSGITRVDDVSYVGPGVSGLYLYDANGSPVILDIWLPRWESLRMTIRELTPHATWAYRQRGWLVG
jgi:hypothetical protein